MLVWGEASPENRPAIERKMGLILGVRHHAVEVIWRRDPLRVARKLNHPAIDPESLLAFANAKSKLSSDDLLAAGVLAEDQK